MVNAVVERLDADTIADEPEATLLCIPQSDGEHAAKFLQTFDAPFFKGTQDNLGIRMICFPVPSPFPFQLAPDLRMVINLTIEDDLQRSIIIAHGLCGSRGKIDNGKPPM